MSKVKNTSIKVVLTVCLSFLILSSCLVFSACSNPYTLEHNKGDDYVLQLSVGDTKVEAINKIGEITLKYMNGTTEEETCTLKNAGEFADYGIYVSGIDTTKAGERTFEITWHGVSVEMKYNVA